jgi:hypothetical protein
MYSAQFGPSEVAKIIIIAFHTWLYKQVITRFLSARRIQSIMYIDSWKPERAPLTQGPGGEEFGLMTKVKESIRMLRLRYFRFHEVYVRFVMKILDERFIYRI